MTNHTKSGWREEGYLLNIIFSRPCAPKTWPIVGQWTSIQWFWLGDIGHQGYHRPVINYRKKQWHKGNCRYWLHWKHHLWEGDLISRHRFKHLFLYIFCLVTVTEEIVSWFVFATFCWAVKQMAVYFIHKNIAEE